MDDDQQFCLRWNNHQSTLISVFDTLLENGTLVDCTLAAEGKFLKAHKVVLSACSPYFATLLSQQYDKHPIFILKDVKFQELRAMMDYMYRGEVNISQDQLAALLKAAESLQIKGLSDNRSSSSSGSSGLAAGGVGAHQQQTQQKQQSDASAAAKTLQPPVPASKASGLTIENKRPLKSELLESDVSGSREGSTSPTRKRKKVRRRSVDTNNLLIDNHDQHSNSSSHSIHTASGTGAGATAASAGGAAITGAPVAAVASAGASSLSSSAVGGGGGGAGGATPGSNSGANVLSAAAVAAVAAIKKTETAQQAAAAAELMKLQLQKQQIAAAAAGQSSDDEERCGGPGSVATGTEHGDDGNELTDNEQDGDGGSSVKSGARHHHHREGRRGNKTSTSTVGDLLIEPKSEYEDGQDENIEDLTMDDEELMDELDQAGPSHGGDVSSQGYAQWPLDREQNEAFLAAQDAVGGQHRDAQAAAPVDSKAPAITTHQSSLALPQPTPPPPCLTSPMCEFSSVCPRTSTQRLLTATLRAAAAVAAAASKSHLPPGLEDVSGGGADGERRDGCCGDASSIVAANCAAGMMCGGNDAGSSRCGAAVATSASASSASASSTSSAFKCPRCPRAYALSYTLERHMKYECGVAKQFGCVKCGKRFSRKDILKAHITNTKSHCAAAAAAAAYANYESS
uniref:BTB domain-containing protein n=1 Tax=Anopheles atroparvus TaxID=41427 RepID=A0AAG5D528_ANOAO